VGNLYSILVGKAERKRLLEKPDFGGRIILKSSFEDKDVRIWAGVVWFRLGPSDRLL
jgi:hypothetical protein